MADGSGAQESPLDDALTALERALAAFSEVVPRPAATVRLVEVELSVDGPRALGAALDELRARPDVLDARARRMGDGRATVVALVLG